MNKQRRQQLAEIKTRIEAVVSDLNLVNDEEQDAFNNMPEGLQCSERGETSEEAIGNMEDALNSLDEALEYIDDAML